MTAWDRLDDELDAWRNEGRRATLWCRDDDASRDSPALRHLLRIADAWELPVALAAIPATMERSLIDAVASSPTVTVVQHGYAHRNHAPAGVRRCELSAHRPMAETVAELIAGREVLEREFGERFAAVLVPPWNRIDADVVLALASAGFRGLSCIGPRMTATLANGVVQSNAHVDLIAWRTNRAFVGTEIAIDRLIGHLRARRGGDADAAEPTGLLTHHLDMDDAAWKFVADLVARTREREAVTWLDTLAVFDAPDADAAISDRSA
jgi:hypothetical protein